MTKPTIWSYRQRYFHTKDMIIISNVKRIKLQITPKSFQGRRNTWGREDWSLPYFGRLINQGNKIYPPIKLVPSTIFDISAALFIEKHVLLDWFIHRFYPQNGICNQKYHFWPKNDGEKWFRKIYFEIPPCGRIVISFTELVIFSTFMK